MTVKTVSNARPGCAESEQYDRGGQAQLSVEMGVSTVSLYIRTGPEIAPSGTACAFPSSSPAGSRGGAQPGTAGFFAPH